MSEPSIVAKPSATPDAKARPVNNVVVLGWAALFSGMSQEMVYPLLPTFVVLALATSPAGLGAIEGALVVGVTIARLVSARLLDRGRSPLRLTRISYAASLIARPLIAFAPTVAVVGSLRVLDGLGKGGKDGPRDFLVAADAQVDRTGRSFGLQRALDTFGSVIGPLVAGGILLVVGHRSWGLRFVFACAAIPAIGAVWALRRAHDSPVHGQVRADSIETPPTPSGKESTDAAMSAAALATPGATGLPGRVPFTRPFIVLLIAVTLFGFANSSDTLLLLRASSVGMTAAQLAFVFAAFNLAYALLAIPAGILSDRIGRRPLLIVGWATYVLVYLGFAYATAPWQVVGLFVVYGIYFASAEGTLKAWVSSLVPPERRGAAYGIFAAASGLLVLPASVIAGLLWDRYGPKPAFLLGAVFAAAALIVILVAPSLRQPATPHNPERA